MTTYMKMHAISDFLDKWILALIAARRGVDCQDPAQADTLRLDFHEDYLTALTTEPYIASYTGRNSA
ncbi:hypothetical protein DIPPA_13916 [Diplonema papillatum]|nr:hypothetical protein DIPPA_13916 [Diplonema papillatum]